MTLSETFDTLEAVIGDVVIDDSVDDDRFEPRLAAAPFFIEFDEPARLDPQRAGLVWELVPAVSRAIRLRSPVVSLAFHLLPIVAIILFPLIVVEPPPPIPVQLVIKQAPPEPEPQPVERPPTPPQPVHAEAQSQSAQPAPVQSAPPTPPVRAEAQTRPVPLPPKPAAVSHPAKPPPAPASTPPPPHEAPIAQFPSAGTSRDGYLAYLVTLTEQHIDLLPRSLVGSRRGKTVLSIAVRRDGVIDRIAIAQSSGYPDIDDRVEQMVAAVRKFPPVPDAFEGSPVELDLDFLFPEALRAH